MKVNSRVHTERTDMFEGIQIPNCPTMFKQEAENIVMLLTEPGLALGSYRNMTQFDKLLMVNYWLRYDGLTEDMTFAESVAWFVQSATAPELIRRARQWLVEHNYLLPDPGVAEHAIEAGEHFRQGVKH